MLQSYHRLTACFSLEGTSEGFLSNSLLRARITPKLDQGPQDQGARWALSSSKGGHSTASLGTCATQNNLWGTGRGFLCIDRISLVASCACCLLSFQCSLRSVWLFCLSNISFSYRRQQLDHSPFSLLFSSLVSPSELCTKCRVVSETILIPGTEKETRTVDCLMEGVFLLLFWEFFHLFLLLREVPFSYILLIVPPDCGLTLGSEPAFAQGFWRTYMFCLEVSGFGSGCLQHAILPHIHSSQLLSCWTRFSSWHVFSQVINWRASNL